MGTDLKDRMLAAMLDALLPGGDGWPAVAETHVAKSVAARAQASVDFARALDLVFDVLPREFSTIDADARTAALRDAEKRVPEAFTQIVTEAYRGYYTDERVLVLIERKTKYPARPPQPLGRSVRAADWSVLDARAIAPAPLPALLDSLGDSHDS